MPDTVETRISPNEIQARRNATRHAIESARIEGLAVSDAAREIMELHNRGEITTGEMIKRIRDLHVPRR